MTRVNSMEHTHHEPLRILHVLGSLDRGGAETLVMNAYRVIDRRLIQFDFVCHGPGPWDFGDEVESLGGRIFVAPRYGVSTHARYLRWWNALFAAHPELRVVHGHMTSTAAIYLRVARKHNRATIAHSHNTRSAGNWLVRSVKKRLRRHTPGMADVLLACSDEAGLALFGRLPSGQVRYSIVRNGIDLSVYAYSVQTRAEVRAEFGIEDRLVIGHVGRFEQQKNHEFLLRVFQYVLREKPTSVLLLVGRGSLENAVRRQADALGVQDSVIFAGVRTDVSRLLQAMDVFVFPSHFEGLGVALIEAQAAGLPTLASTAVPPEARVVPEFEFIDLSVGPQEWASRILECVGAPRRNTQSELMSAGFDISRVSDTLQRLYLELDSGRRR